MPVERRERVIAVWLGSTGNGRNPMFNGRRQPSRGGTSRMMREYQIRFCERLGVKFPGPTRHKPRRRSGPGVGLCPHYLPSRRNFMHRSERRQVPGPDSCSAAKTDHSITLSARSTSPAGTSCPIALAVWRLITSSNRVGCSTGMSAGAIPRSTFASMRAS
jgi:hypothetical protein